MEFHKGNIITLGFWFLFDILAITVGLYAAVILPVAEQPYLELVNHLLIKNYVEAPITNIVFMGMGEPFLNYNNVITAANLMNDKESNFNDPSNIFLNYTIYYSVFSLYRILFIFKFLNPYIIHKFENFIDLVVNKYDVMNLSLENGLGFSTCIALMGLNNESLSGKCSINELIAKSIDSVFNNGFVQ